MSESLATDAWRQRCREALLRRAQGAPAAVQARLQARVQQGWPGRRDLVDGAMAPMAAQPPTGATPPGLTALRALNAGLRPSHHAADVPVPGGAAALPEMKNLAGFRRAWSQAAAELQVSQALARAPEQAGPLNSHRLVLHTLEQMRALSPVYLSRYLAQLEALLWLEQLQWPAAQGGGQGKPARRARSRA
ncbi:DUF2894 domain-containing protein [Macromonas nakdongensis]|uniref:DUF2894 domain-containing protein n=1 Tax=Macromonas nakdongensis TaxID=1843082 RepID=UPI000C31D278|nr:DUF2894 domain-containing protein [Macromonas nakdongensis]